MLRTLFVFVLGAALGATLVFLKQPNRAPVGPPKAVLESDRVALAPPRVLVVSLDPKGPAWSLDQEPKEEFYTFTEPYDGVLFDLDGDGWRERIAWPASGTKLALLVRDLNRNGIVDNGKEFERLVAPPRARAMRMGDPSLPPEPRVMLWHDANRNGFSEPNELHDGPSKGWMWLGDIEGRSLQRRGFFSGSDGQKRELVEVVLRSDRGGFPRF